MSHSASILLGLSFAITTKQKSNNVYKVLSLCKSWIEYKTCYMVSKYWRNLVNIGDLSSSSHTQKGWRLLLSSLKCTVVFLCLTDLLSECLDILVLESNISFNLLLTKEVSVVESLNCWMRNRVCAGSDLKMLCSAYSIAEVIDWAWFFPIKYVPLLCY